MIMFNISVFVSSHLRWSLDCSSNWLKQYVYHLLQGVFTSFFFEVVLNFSFLADYSAVGVIIKIHSEIQSTQNQHWQLLGGLQALGSTLGDAIGMAIIGEAALSPDGHQTEGKTNYY